MGASAALIVAAISYVTRVSPESCLMRATAAFVVFAAFGVILRYFLADAGSHSIPAHAIEPTAALQSGPPVDDVAQAEE